MPPKFYSVSEAAKLLGVSRQSIHLAINRGILKATQGKIEVTRIVKTLQRGLRISETELRKYRPSEMHQWLGKKNY
jgi:excisionase family DNA binding protein